MNARNAHQWISERTLSKSENLRQLLMENSLFKTAVVNPYLAKDDLKQLFFCNKKLYSQYMRTDEFKQNKKRLVAQKSRTDSSNLIYQFLVHADAEIEKKKKYCACSPCVVILSSIETIFFAILVTCASVMKFTFDHISEIKTDLANCDFPCTYLDDELSLRELQAFFEIVGLIISLCILGCVLPCLVTAIYDAFNERDMSNHKINFLPLTKYSGSLQIEFKTLMEKGLLRAERVSEKSSINSLLDCLSNIFDELQNQLERYKVVYADRIAGLEYALNPHVAIIQVEDEKLEESPAQRNPRL